MAYLGTNMKVVHCKKERFDIYIGRPSPFGNPFVIGKHGTREECIIKYKHYLVNNKKLLDKLRAFTGNEVLGCWCYPQDCHGYAIIEVYKDLNENRI